MKTLLRMVGLLAVGGATSVYAQQNVTINFDTEANWSAQTTPSAVVLTSYASGHSYSQSNWFFTGGPALRNTTAVQDSVAGALGTYSWRLRDGVAVSFTGTYTAALAPNERFTSFSFDARRWDGSPSPAYTVSYSLNGGTDWTTATLGSSGVLNNTAFGNVSSWSTFSQSISSTVGLGSNQFIVRFSATTGERVMIDNFSFTTAIPEPSSFAALAGLGMLGFCATRRRR